jgi:hypothetical protein
LRRFVCAMLKKKSQRLPDFLVIGAQKSGTSWLHQNLLHHPDVFVPQKKELHYFNSDLKKSLRDYASYFAEAEARVIGEITPAYSILTDVDIQFVKSLMPRAKLILLMRDPIERAWSQAVMEVADRTGRKVGDVPDSEFIEFLKSWPSFGRSDYPTMLANWENHFDGKAIFTGFLEQVRSGPEDLLNNIFDHIGVSRIDDWHGFPVRKIVAPDVGKRVTGEGKSGAGFAVHQSAPEHKEQTLDLMPDAVRGVLKELYANVLVQLKLRFGDDLPNW